MSLIHPGTSINFDGTDLQRSEEEEIQREDIKQQQELHELLSAELPEDLLNDSCNGSVASQSRPDHDQQSYGNSQVSSSNTGSWQSGSSDGGPISAIRSVSASGDASNFFTNQTGGARHHFTNGYGKEYGMNGYDQPYTDAEKWQMQQQQQQQQQQQMHHQSVGRHQIPTQHDSAPDQRHHYRTDPYNTNYVDPEPEVYGFTERREAEGSEDFDAVGLESSYLRDKVSRAYSAYPPTGAQSSVPGKNVRFDQIPTPTSPYANSSYPVQYKAGNRYAHRDDVSQSPKTTSNPNKTDDSVGSDYVDASDVNLTGHEDSGESRELTQLRILYDARGKKIEKLTREVDALRQDTDREKRILAHQLAMTEDQRLGVTGSLEESQRLLVEKDRKINEEEGKANALLIEVESLKAAKAELVKKAEVGERTIENLQQEVTLLQRSDLLERTRQQHDDVISNLNEQHERHLMEVTTMLDEVRRAADEKTEEAEQLRTRLKAALKESEDVLFEKSETINRLSRNLEDAQNHCQSLLAGSGECAFLQRQVSDLSKEKTALDEKNKTLEAEIRELQKNFSMYENAFRLGVTPRPLTPDGMTESYSELMGIKQKLDWNVAKGEGCSPDDLVGSLRQELERALSSNKEKRDKIADLQKQVEYLHEEARHWRERMDEVKRERTNNSSNKGSNPSQGELENELEDSLHRVHAAEERALRLEETCRDLKQQMCELVEQHDANKQEAVDRCERACMLLHEDAKQAIREELMAEYEQKTYELSVEHDGGLLELRSKLECVSNELSDVKQSYVHICSEKDRVEEEMGRKLNTELDALSSKYEKEKEELRAEFEKKWEEIKEEKEKEWEERNEEQISTKIALAKVKWMEEHANLREDALRDLTKKKDEEFTRKLEALRSELKVETEKEISRMLEEEKNKWEVEKESEIETRVNELYEELNEEKKTAVSAATSIAQLNWITEQRNSTETEFEKRLDEARRQWREEHERAIDVRVEDAVKKMKNKIEVLNDERDALVSQEVRRAEKEWRRKRDESLRRKDEEMHSQLKKIQDKHQKEYEEFTKHHKETLERFLQTERSKSSAQEKQTDAVDEMQKQWSTERDQLLHEYQSDLNSLQAMHESRCQDYRSEIQRLSAAYGAVVQRLSMLDDHEAALKIVDIEKKNREEMDRLKSRMKDEYRRWKRERDDLKAKLEGMSDSAKPAQDTASRLDPKLFNELREIYISTLGTIKGEMLGFIRDSRERSVDALSREAGREKERIATKLRSRQRRNEFVYPSFLNEQRSTLQNAKSSKFLPVQGSPTAPPSKQSRTRDSSPPTKQFQPPVERNKDFHI